MLCAARDWSTRRGWRALTRRQCHSTTASDWTVGVIDLGPCSPSACLAIGSREILPELFWGRTRVTLSYLSAILIGAAKHALVRPFDGLVGLLRPREESPEDVDGWPSASNHEGHPLSIHPARVLVCCLCLALVSLKSFLSRSLLQKVLLVSLSFGFQL